MTTATGDTRSKKSSTSSKLTNGLKIVQAKDTTLTQVAFITAEMLGYKNYAMALSSRDSKYPWPGNSVIASSIVAGEKVGIVNLVGEYFITLGKREEIKFDDGVALYLAGLIIDEFKPTIAYNSLTSKWTAWCSGADRLLQGTADKWHEAVIRMCLTKTRYSLPLDLF